MNFKRKKIRKIIKESKRHKKIAQDEVETLQGNFNKKYSFHIDEISKTEKALKTKRRLKISIPIVTSLLIVLALGVGIVKAISSINVTTILELAGEELQTDAYGHSNFLLLGTAGEKNEGTDLTDTIIVASLDPENSIVSMVSIPRDLYVKSEIIPDSKINEIYLNAMNHYGNSRQGIEHLKDELETILGIPIHYWAKVNFDGFKDLIDAIGGVDVYVEERIYDPYYPKDGTYLYEPFLIEAGQQHLDGETALKYARSRKTTSDFDRARRQQQLIHAIKEQALNTEVIFSQEKIKEILAALKANIETNIKIREILMLGSMADQFSEENIVHKLIHDDPTKCGGFLYTPMRQYYGGMFVLLPAGGFDYLHTYADLVFGFPRVNMENAKIHILNGTGIGGVAGETKMVLKRLCFEINRHGNAATSDLEQTTYYYKQKFDEDGNEIDSRPLALDFLKRIIPGRESTQIPLEYQDYMVETDILLEIGKDYTSSDKYIEDPFYYLPAATPSPTSTPSTTTETTETTE